MLLDIILAVKKVGVPQGSCFGSLLFFFLLYINDLLFSSNFDLKLYTDDTG